VKVPGREPFPILDRMSLNMKKDIFGNATHGKKR
jgi:hypothetical protein